MIPVLRPRLPSADRLLPYLRRLDAARIYSNWGPLCGELEERVAARFGRPRDTVVSASSGTAALTGAILGTAGRGNTTRPLALLPSFTFVATALAVEHCGYEPYLMDVDPESWQLDPLRLTDEGLLRRAGLVVPVSAFGRRLPLEAWATFRDRTGIPVVADAAACFEALEADRERPASRIPLAVSFHATKSFATGEGGCVIAPDAAAAMPIRRALNFGFHDNRESRGPSTNGKMSEYHAAVGLAELDEWETKSAALAGIARNYQERFRGLRRDGDFFGAPDVASCYALFRCATPSEAGRVSAALLRFGVDHRFWYGGGVHRQPQYATLPHGDLGVTDAIASRLIGLPVAVDLDDASFDVVTRALAAGLADPVP